MASEVSSLNLFASSAAAVL